MKKTFRLIFEKSAFLSMIHKALQILGGILLVFVMTSYVSLNNQGLYYTFLSLLAAQVFFELGLTQAVSQIISHDMFKLTWNDMCLEGENEYLVRIVSLIKTSIKWYVVSSLLFFIIILFVGLSILSNTEIGLTEILLPWVLAVLSASLLIPLNGFVSLLESCGKVDDVYKIRTLQSVFQTVITLISFTLDMNLYSISIGAFGGLFAGVLCVLLKYSRFIFFVFFEAERPKNNHYREIFTLQWRVAISWGASYFIFNIFNPILVMYDGPISAGQFGMTLQIISAFFALTSVWVNVKAPVFGQLAGSRSFKRLKKEFFHAFKVSTALMLTGGVFICFCVFIINSFELSFANRILKPYLFLMVFAAAFTNAIVSLLAIYIRAFKVEPFVYISVTHALLTLSLCLYLIPKIGVLGGVLAMLIPALLISLTGGVYLFKSSLRRAEITQC